MKQNKFLLTWLGMFPGYRTFSSISELTDHEKEFIKEGVGKLFKVDEDGNIVEINSNGRIKK